jgi:hypothetical protein
VLLAAAAVLVPPAASDATPRAYAPPVPSVLHAGSATPWLAETTALQPGQWRLAISSGYINTWRYSMLPGNVHRELGRQGESFGDDLPDEIAARFPDAEADHIDVDAFRSDLMLARGFSGGWTVSLRVPWIRIGAPNGDFIAEAFHEAFGFKEQRRNFFPRGETTVYAQGDAGLLYADEALDGSSLGDIAVTVAAPVGTALDGRHRFSVTIEAPTGDEGTLRGSGGWDVAGSWTGVWETGRYAVLAGAGFAALDEGGSFLDIERENTWHAGVEVSRPVGRHWSGYVAVRLDTSPIEGFAGLSDPLVAAQFGVVRRVFGGWHGTVSSSQNLTGPAADFGFHVALSTTWGHR